MVDDCPNAFVLHPQLPSELFKQVAIRVRRCASKQAAGQGEIAVLNVQACVEQIVRGGQGHISLRSFQYGKILQMRVAVRKQIIEQHQTCLLYTALRFMTARAVGRLGEQVHRED